MAQCNERKNAHRFPFRVRQGWTTGVRGVEGRSGGLAHLRGLTHLGASDIQKYCLRPTRLTSHHSCTQTLPSFPPQPAATEPSSGPPVADVLRNTPIVLTSP
jgi:hypothetical protein